MHKWPPCKIDFGHEKNSEVSALLKKSRLFLQLEQIVLKQEGERVVAKKKKKKESL